jgi:hypothetical protein
MALHGAHVGFVGADNSSPAETNLRSVAASTVSTSTGPQNDTGLLNRSFALRSYGPNYDAPNDPYYLAVKAAAAVGGTIFKEASEALTAADTAPAITVSAPVVDGLSVSEPAATLIPAVTASDLATLSELIVLTAPLVNRADGGGLSESAGVASTTAAADTALLSAATPLLTQLFAVTDSGGLTDLIANLIVGTNESFMQTEGGSTGLVASLSPFENFTLAEPTPTLLQTILVAASDAGLLAEVTAAVSEVALRAAAETFAMSEGAPSLTQTLFQAAADSLTYHEATILLSQRESLDGAALAESIQSLRLDAVDSWSLATEAAQTLQTALLSASESLALTDAAQATRVNQVSASEALELSEAFALADITLKVASEAAALADASVLQAMTFIASSEAIGLGESAAMLAELYRTGPAALSEASLVLGHGTASDQGTALDLAQVTGALFVAVSDALTATDLAQAPSVSLFGSDAAALSEAFELSAAVARSESVFLSDALLLAGNILAQEGWTLAEFAELTSDERVTVLSARVTAAVTILGMASASQETHQVDPVAQPLISGTARAAQGAYRGSPAAQPLISGIVLATQEESSG